MLPLVFMETCWPAEREFVARRKSRPLLRVGRREHGASWGLHLPISLDGTAYAAYGRMAQNSRPKIALLIPLGVALIVGATAAANAHRRSAEKARLLADIHRIEMPASGYAIETSASPRTPEDTAWRLYCERERVTLIADARAAAGQ